MKQHDITHNDGSRSIQMRTPCGFEITLMRTVERSLKIACYFEHQPVCLMNSHYRLSEHGAVALQETIKEIFK